MGVAGAGGKDDDALFFSGGGRRGGGYGARPPRPCGCADDAGMDLQRFQRRLHASAFITVASIPI